MSLRSREIAVAALTAVERGAYAEVALREALSQGSPGAALATALTYGTLRLRRRCDYRLRPLLRRPLDQLEPVLRAVLRVGCYELLWARECQPASVVHDLVDVAREQGHERLAKFTNGVLRAVARDADEWRTAPAELQGPEALAERLVHWESHPRWVVTRWLERFGAETAMALCAAGNREPQLHLRTNPARCTRDELLARLRAAGVAAEPGPWHPAAIHLTAAGAVEALPGWSDGWFTVQDEGAMLIAEVAEAQPGQRAIDLCAAPGGKATQLAAAVGARGRVLACDRSEGRLRQVEVAAERLGLRTIDTRSGDVRGLEREVQPVDLVLLDAPCSGSGTLARRPDLRWRLGPQRLGEVVALQRELLQTAAALVRPGGLLVYATCSVESEENEAQMAWFDAEQRGFEPDGALGQPPPGWSVPSAWATLLPLAADHDGFFVARRRRVT